MTKTMRKPLIRVGHSKAIVIDKMLLSFLGVKGQYVQIALDGDKLVVSKPRGKS